MSSGKDFVAREAAEDSQVPDAPLQSLPTLRTPARVLPEIPNLPYLLQESRAEGRDPGSEKGELVGSESAERATNPMSMTDPVADLLTRIRNANSNGYKTMKVPYSVFKKNILRVLKEQGFIVDYTAEMEKGKGILRVELKYGPDGEKIIRSIRRVSTPGRRVYTSVEKMPDVLGGLGITILSTPRGVISSVEARKLKIGGEVLCEVW